MNINPMNINVSPNLNYAWAASMVEELVRNGVTYFCIAPGSRSSPLVAAAARHPNVKTVVHYDERGLAFYALGLVSVTKYPAVLICTSGTAAANFFPAVIETSKKKLPLILLTADRPPELRDTGALQTINQVKLYGDYVRWFTDLPAPDEQIDPAFLLTTMDQAVFRSINPMPGPVHINCMFREPLAPEETGFYAEEYVKPVAHWLKKKNVYTEYTTGTIHTDFSGDKRLVSVLNKTKRGIIVVGKLGAPEEQQAVLKLSEKLNWPVFPDIVSGLRTRSHKNIILYYDQILTVDSFAEQFPVDTVLHLGGRITSKRWYQYAEKMRPRNYISVLAHSLRNDPLHMVTKRVKSKVADFAESMTPLVTATPGGDGYFLERLREYDRSAGEFIDRFTREHEKVNEIGVARAISRLLPDGHGLFLSNSMPVRDMDMYAAPGGATPVIGGNRGASGIDGIIASACGFARALDTGVTLLIGDIAFLHDLNSSAFIKTLKKNLIIVVINNNGGGIFSFLPIAGSPAASDIFEPYFAAPHGMDFQKAAQFFDLHYSAPTTMTGFADCYKKALEATTATIIEIKTDRNENAALHRQLQEKIRKGDYDVN